MDRLDADFYNHGQDGLKTVFTAFVATHEAQETERQREQERQHQANSQKINLLIAIATVIGVIVAAVGIFVTVEVSRHAQLDPAKIFHSYNPEPETARQSAIIPPLTR